MKMYTILFTFCFLSLITTMTVSAQGFRGPSVNPPQPEVQGVYPPSPQPVGPGAYPPAPPPAGPGAYPPSPPLGGPGAYPPPLPQDVPYQYGFTGSVRTVTVEQAKTYDHRTPVVVTGSIVQAIGGDLYTFRDSTGTITLRIGPREWYMLGSNIGPSDKLEISGELHRDWQRAPEIHARYIRKI